MLPRALWGGRARMSLVLQVKVMGGIQAWGGGMRPWAFMLAPGPQIFHVVGASGKLGKVNELLISSVKGKGDPVARPWVWQFAEEAVLCHGWRWELRQGQWSRCSGAGSDPGNHATPAGWESRRSDGREVCRLGELVVKTWVSWALPPGGERWPSKIWPTLAGDSEVGEGPALLKSGSYYNLELVGHLFSKC